MSAGGVAIATICENFERVIVECVTHILRGGFDIRSKLTKQ
jgi:hypothetical protein